MNYNASGNITHSPNMGDSVYRQTLEEAVGALAWLDADGRIRACNRRLATWLGLPQQQLIGQLIGDILVCFTQHQWVEMLAELTQGAPLCLRDFLKIPGPGDLAVEMTLWRLPGDPRGVSVLHLRDRTSEFQSESIRELQHEVLEAVAIGRPLMMVVDLLCRKVEALAPEVICTVLLVDEQGRVHPCAAPSMPSIFSEAIDGEPIGPRAGSCGTAAYRGEPVEVTDIANDPLWEHYKALAIPLGLAACWSSPIKLRDGRVAGTFALYYREPRSASPFHRQMVNACLHLCSLAIEHEEVEAQIHQLAFHDSLTGLANRALLHDRGDQALARAHRTGRPVTVMFLDLDRFKTVNDSLGHSVGDRMLKEVAHRLQHCIRDTDTLSRPGGDEFVVLMLNSDATAASHAAEKMLNALVQPISVGSLELALRASIGISLYPYDGSDFDTLLKNADIAMYQAKASGRNTMRFYQPEMNAAATEQLAMEAALRQAIEAGELTVHYQPQVNVRQQRLHGLEALVRWQHPRWGLVSPATFIPLAEESGLINAIDHFVLNQACRQLKHWHSQGWVIPQVSVNLSPTHFYFADVLERITEVLQQSQLSPDCLTLEITERLMLNTNSSITETMKALRHLGVRLSVDDFGTGYSSLSYLKRFPINELKLDQTFVQDINDDADNQALADAIITLGQVLQLTVVAEGVETPEQLSVLESRGCEVIQGYLLARPQPPEQLEAWFQAEGHVFIERIRP